MHSQTSCCGGECQCGDVKVNMTLGDTILPMSKLYARENGRKIRVYVASPYTNGDVAVNVRAQLEAADKIMSMKGCPIIPLYSHFQHMIFPRPYEEWMSNDYELLRVCDVLLRLPGLSPGADREVQWAGEMGIQVVYSLDELENFIKNWSVPCQKSN